MVKAFELLFGLAFGSFANVVIYRLPRGESIVRPPSHCTSCDRQLSNLELVPVFSWLFLRGRCKTCGARISWRYPAVELLCALLFVSVEPRFCLFAFFLLCISFVDLYTQTIPDSLVIALGISGLLCLRGIPDALLGAAIGGGTIFLIDRVTLLLVKKDGFGFGDVLLMVAIGLALGVRLTLLTLFFGFIAGAVAGVFVKLRMPTTSYIPFAPFLSLGAMLSVWFGENLIGWYTGLLGF